MKTKIIALLLALVAILGVFASCDFGGDNTDDDEKDGPGDVGNNTSAYPWKTTNLIFQVTENSNSNELPSTCRRYLAGDTTGIESSDQVDQLVKARNTAALTATNVTVEYAYLPDTSAYSWGQNIDAIHASATSEAASAPDIFCNFVYDMVACSLKGSFANLLSTTMYEDGHELAGAEHNYFAFEDEINLEDDGKGYMTEYMRSLSLSKYKMYCLSSDYFTDMVRAFLVVPVNISLLEGFSVSENDGEYNSDRANKNGEKKKDGDFTIADFYQLVWDYDWTYDTLAKFSDAIYSDDGGSTGQDIQDRLGFALATSSGLSASGMLYTTNITIIKSEMDYAKGDYAYSYPNTTTNDGGKTFSTTGNHADLAKFCAAMSGLINTEGVIAIDDIDGSAVTNTTAPGNALNAIRMQFASNRILFGGVICLGSLELDDYMGMNGEGKSGYGVVPVPLYDKAAYVDENGEIKKDENGKDLGYLTQIHNVGRVGAVAYATDKFAQCSAYLNYQSLNSTDILNTYYDVKLQYGVVDSNVVGTVEMLQYIRYNVRSSFDKAYEDALGIFYSTVSEDESKKQQWHTMIKDDGYDFTEAEMAQAYASIAHIKAKRLYDLEHSTFPTLPS